MPADRLPAGAPAFLTYGSKWDERDPYFGATDPCCPADIDAGCAAQIRQLAERAFAELVGCGYARVDMRMNARGQIMILEVNPNPDIGPSSGARLQAERSGLSYRDFIGKIMAVAGAPAHGVAAGHCAGANHA